MRNVLVFIGLFLGISMTANATNLIDVYQQAAVSDPVFQQAISQSFADKENVPISLANLLPNIGVSVQPGINKVEASGPAATIGSYSNRVLLVNASVTQTIFNFAQFSNLAGANATAKQAEANLNTAAQSLMLRVSKAYFAILQDEDNLRYADANKAAYAKSLDQVNQQYKVGLKTITDVYTAKAAYDSSTANYIATDTLLSNDKENLRAITGNIYPSLAKLSENFPLTSPKPSDIDRWVETAKRQNWSVKAAQYASDVAMQNVKQQFAGHLPTLNAQGNYVINTTRNTGGSSPTGIQFLPAGTSQMHTRTVQLNLNVPIFAGGGVVAQTKQAQYAYQVSSQQLEQTVRSTINSTRQSYLGVIAGISKVEADKQTVISTQSSYEGLEAQYRVGTATLVDVLNQQQKVLQAQQQYATDRYAYINNLLTLKQSAGTLSPEDLNAINTWLSDNTDLGSDTIHAVHFKKGSVKKKKKSVV